MESRNTLTESARVARGEIQSLDQLNVEEFDVLFVPGGPRMSNFIEF